MKFSALTANARFIPHFGPVVGNASPTWTQYPKDWAETFQLVKPGAAHPAVTVRDGGCTGTSLSWQGMTSS